MGKIIALSNNKGGVGKTTTAIALTAALVNKGYKVLIIDTDPQCNTSDTFKAQSDEALTLYDVLYNKTPISSTVQHTSYGDIVPGDPMLNRAEKFLNDTGREFILKKAVAEISDEYDFIIIDTPPSLGILLVNAITAADYIIIVITTDRYSMQGLAQLNETINAAREYTNPGLKLLGLLLTKVHARTNIAKDVIENIPVFNKILNTETFETKIRESTAVREAQARRESIFDFAPRSNTAVDYMSFTEELLRRLENG